MIRHTYMLRYDTLGRQNNDAMGSPLQRKRTHINGHKHAQDHTEGADCTFQPTKHMFTYKRIRLRPYALQNLGWPYLICLKKTVPPVSFTVTRCAGQTMPHSRALTENRWKSRALPRRGDVGPADGRVPVAHRHEVAIKEAGHAA